MPPNDPTYTYGSQNEGAADPADDYVVITPGATDLANGVCKALSCSTDGFLKLTNARGQTRDNVPVYKGYNPLRALKVENPTSGSAPTVIAALY